MSLDLIKEQIIDVANFPKPGIIFKDITPLLAHQKAFASVVDHMSEVAKSYSATTLAGIESRGFIFASALAQKLNMGFHLIRKPGKLPRPTFKQDYDLEYGSDQLHIHQKALKNTDRVLIVDDVLATGGTARAAELLCQQTGAQLAGHCFLMEISFLNGGEKLISPYTALVKY